MPVWRWRESRTKIGAEEAEGENCSSKPRGKDPPRHPAEALQRTASLRLESEDISLQHGLHQALRKSSHFPPYPSSGSAWKTGGLLHGGEPKAPRTHRCAQPQGEGRSPRGRLQGQPGSGDCLMPLIMLGELGLFKGSAGV